MSLFNGQRSAVSLTFDDGLPVQIHYALPEMDKLGLPGTFFLIQNSTYDTEFRIDTWKAAIAKGHEIGSHSVNHLKASTLNSMTAWQEAEGSKRFLQETLGVRIDSFCYPYTDAPSHLQLAVAKHYKQARGGRGARADKFVKPGDRDLNFYNTPAFHVGPTSFKQNEIWDWLKQNTQRGSWITLMFHGVGPVETEWDNVTSEEFRRLLETLDSLQQSGDVWVAPYGTVADNFRKHRGW